MLLNNYFYIPADIRVDVTLGGEHLSKKDKTYIKWTDKKVGLKVGKSHFNFSNFLPGQVELTAEVNKLINENSDDIVKEFISLVEGAIDKIAISTYSNVFNLYSLEELFPA